MEKAWILPRWILPVATLERICCLWGDKGSPSVDFFRCRILKILNFDLIMNRLVWFYRLVFKVLTIINKLIYCKLHRRAIFLGLKPSKVIHFKAYRQCLLPLSL